MSFLKQNNIPAARTTEPSALRKRKKQWLTVRELCIFSMLGALTFCSKLLMEWAPNIHFLAMFIITFTLVYRIKALVPIYVFVLLAGVYGGFNVWWIPYLYIWLPLWALALLLPRRAPIWLLTPLAMLIGGLHGICYGILYAPAEALFFGMDLKTTLAWLASGVPFDILHAIGNLAACTLVYPITRLLLHLEKSSKH